MNPQQYHPTKTRKQIADEYAIHERTFRRWLNAAGIKLPNRLLASNEQNIIYDEFGSPFKGQHNYLYINRNKL